LKPQGFSSKPEHPMVWRSSNNSPLSTSSRGTSGTIFRILTLLGTSLFFFLCYLVMGETVLFTAILKVGTKRFSH
jgi:hypothetical protein